MRRRESCGQSQVVHFFTFRHRSPESNRKGSVTMERVGSKRIPMRLHQQKLATRAANKRANFRSCLPAAHPPQQWRILGRGAEAIKAFAPS
ncbi:hypothetical protein AVEN_183150-1 [Araneus ventricosus]|uniref:Uncharacterized protein n=1 Tax=Araneus ventricosus TaxID=182803 RepID=A0A4Y2SRD9_ARAVE|nr:hypothetical protein AVEN_183150-1 [Araneus ventricosus]